MSDEIIALLRSSVYKNNSNLKAFFNNTYTDTNNSYFNLLPSENVAKGTAVVDDNLRYQFNNAKIKNEPISIYVSNIYYKDELNLKVSDTYIKSNFKRLTGYDDYDNKRQTVFINAEEYYSLYDKPTYQSSVYVNDVENIDNTIQDLKNMGLSPKKVSDYVVDNLGLERQILQIVKIIVTIIVIFVLFFISYFIIKIILKSRNVYYTTLRILGATYKSVRRILDIELFINSSLAYFMTLALLYLINIDVIHIEYIAKLIKYVGFAEYAILYIVIIAMSRLISRRFSKKLFKNTAMNTYKEEV